jgi:hypothetical protein
MQRYNGAEAYDSKGGEFYMGSEDAAYNFGLIIGYILGPIIMICIVVALIRFVTKKTKKIKMGTRCPACGRKIVSGSVRCYTCGTYLSRPQPRAEQPMQQPAKYRKEKPPPTEKKKTPSNLWK